MRNFVRWKITHDDTDDDVSNSDDLECLDDDGSDGDKDEADCSVPDEGGHPVGDWAY